MADYEPLSHVTDLEGWPLEVGTQDGHPVVAGHPLDGEGTRLLLRLVAEALQRCGEDGPA